MSAALLLASGRAVVRPTLLVPLAAAVVLVVVTLPAHDGPHALRVLRGTGVLLALAWLVATEDPGGEVLAAAPVPRPRRTAGRLLAAAVPVVVTWLVLAAVVELRAQYLPTAALGLEALGTAACGLAIGAGLRAWRDLHHPAYVAGAGLLALVLAAEALPRWYVLSTEQTWGPVWAAAHLRWAAVLLLALAALLAAARDDLDNVVVR